MTGILITGARAPVAVHLARLLHGAGHRVVLADSLPRTVGSVSNVARFVVLPAATGDKGVYAEALRTLIVAHDIAVVAPTCEEVFYLAQVWETQDMGARLLAPPMAMLATAHDKSAFQELVAGLGLPHPKTRLLSSVEHLDAVRGDVRELVFKPVWSRFATQVLVRPEPEALRFVPTKNAPWVAQEFVAGVEVCAYAFAFEGEVKGIAAYQPRYRAGKGAGIFLAPESDPAIDDFITKFAKGTHWTGQLSFDFIRRYDGTVLPLECNPRAVSGLHFFQNCEAFADAFLGEGAMAVPDLSIPRAVRLAMWAYGLPTAMKGAALAQFFRDMSAVPDVLDWPGDPAPKRQQLRAMAEVMRVAFRHRISLLDATTHDIAWNGPAL